MSDNGPNFGSAVKIFKEGLVKIKVGTLVDRISCSCTRKFPISPLEYPQWNCCEKMLVVFVGFPET